MTKFLNLNAIKMRVFKAQTFYNFFKNKSKI